MKIIEFKEVKAAGSIKANFSVDLTKLIIKGWKVIQQHGQSAFVAPPSEKYTDREGKIKYRTIIEITDKELADKIKEAALAEAGLSEKEPF